MKLISGFVKTIVFLWLIACAWAAWISLNILAYVLLVSNNMSQFSWIPGLMSATSALTIGVIAVKSLKVDLIAIVRDKLNASS